MKYLILFGKTFAIKPLARSLMMTALLFNLSLLPETTSTVMAQEQAAEIKLRLGDV